MSQEPGEFRAFIERLSAHEAPILIAVREMVAGADDQGSIARQRLVEAFRESYLAHYAGVAPDESVQSRRLLEIRRMTSEEVQTYLDQQVLQRLAAEGWLRSNAHADEVAFAAPVWSDIGDERGAFTQLIEREIESRLCAEREPAAPSPPPSASKVTVRSLVKVYKKRRVVDQVDLELSQGEIVGLLGPNGAGKTTTFYMIVGLIPPESGEVYIDDENVTHVPMYKRARRGIGYLSQEPSVFRRLTVEQNLLAILETLPLSPSEREERLESLLDELSIKHLRKNKAYSLSGGERRRLEITRALVTSPKFMLLDEPFAGIDPIAVDDIQRIVAGLKQRGLGVLITDHNVRETLSITDRAYIMFDGRIHLEGTSEELVSDPQARKLYLGEDFRL